MEPPTTRDEPPEPGSRPAWRRAFLLMALAALVLLPGLGTWSRLSYHEAFVAQGAREMLASGDWGFPTIGGRPWLEKPPLPWWLVAAAGRMAGEVDEAVARFPSAIAAALLALGIATIAARHYGPRIGLVAGAMQITTAWTALRGRLAEADIVLACLVTWAMAAFDVMSDPDRPVPARNRWRWAFFVLLGLTSTVKGIGFGAAMIVAAMAVALAWHRDRDTIRRLAFPAGWIAALTIALAWPMAMIARHGSGALALWTTHITDRLSSHPSAFAGEPWWEYVPGLLIQAMPWTPLAIVGGWHSLRRALAGDRTEAAPPSVIAGDRLLWAWSAAPILLLSMATVKNAHYAIAAQVPWSIWAALGLSRVANRLVRRHRRWTAPKLRRAAIAGFGALGLAYAMGFAMVAPRLDRRAAEWAFYESAARLTPADAPLALLYDDWDRYPYDTPFGAFPHDVGVRLYYLRRPADWFILLGPDGLPGPDADRPLPATSYAIGRDRDRAALERRGRVEVLAKSPSLRFDRTYTMYRVTAGPDAGRLSARTTE